MNPKTIPFAVLLLLGVLISPLRGAFQDRGLGPRAMGMGRAFSAAADDGNALFWNPAGTAFLDGGEASFSWEHLFPGLTGININTGYAEAIIPLQTWRLGAAATIYDAQGLLLESVVLAHVSKKLGDSSAAGVNVKYLRNQFDVASDVTSAGEPLFSQRTGRSVATFDAGFKTVPVPWLELGASGRNVTEPNVGLDTVDRVSAVYQAGAAWKPSPQTIVEGDLLYTDMTESTAMQKLNYAGGVEQWFFAQGDVNLAMRAGANRNELSGGMSVKVSGRSSINFRLDYAFVYSRGSTGSEGSRHIIGLEMPFGGTSGGGRVNKSAPNTQTDGPRRLRPLTR